MASSSPSISVPTQVPFGFSRWNESLRAYDSVRYYNNKAEELEGQEVSKSLGRVVVKRFIVCVCVSLSVRVCVCVYVCVCVCVCV